MATTTIREMSPEEAEAVACLYELRADVVRAGIPDWGQHIKEMVRELVRQRDEAHRLTAEVRARLQGGNREAAIRARLEGAHHALCLALGRPTREPGSLPDLDALAVEVRDLAWAVMRQERDRHVS